MAAAKNGQGVVGVAPGVRLAAVRVSDNNQLFFSEAVVCAFMHAARHKFQVNTSLCCGLADAGVRPADACPFLSRAPTVRSFYAMIVLSS